MHYAEKKLCLFRQLQSVGLCRVPPEDIIRAFAAPRSFTCRVGNCAIRGMELLAGIYGFRREETAAPGLGNLAAPSCAIHEPITPLATGTLPNLRQPPPPPNQE